MRKSVAADEAVALLSALEPPLPGAEELALPCLLGRVLSRDIAAASPIPPFRRSPFDGYAFRGEDTAEASEANPVVLRITEEIPAGRQPSLPVTQGCAAKILTGAPLPEGANAIIKYEQTEFTQTQVKLFAPVSPGKDVILPGEDVPCAALLARRGEVISPAHLGLLAATGVSHAEVYQKPRAAILNTGEEIVMPGNALPPAKIYNSGLFLLGGYLERIGLAPYHGGTVPDDAELIACAIEEHLQLSDIVVTTGGASVGDYDCAVRAAELLGAEILFWKTALKPGGASLFCQKNGKLILMLSGNPGGASLCLLRVALPYLKGLCGIRDCEHKPIEVLLREPFRKSAERASLLRGKLEIEGGKAWFRLCRAQNSGDISSFAEADLLAEIPAFSRPLPEGALVKAFRI